MSDNICLIWFNPFYCQHLLHPAGNRPGRVDNRHPFRHDVPDSRREEGVMRAAQDDLVHAHIEHRLQICSQQ